MSSTTDPRERKTVEGESPEPALEPGQVLELLDGQAAGLHDEIQSLAEAFEGAGELPADRVNAVRTEAMELQAAVEDLLAGHCDGTEPWDNAGELVPQERIEALCDRD